MVRRLDRQRGPGKVGVDAEPRAARPERRRDPGAVGDVLLGSRKGKALLNQARQQRELFDVLRHLNLPANPGDQRGRLSALILNALGQSSLPLYEPFHFPGTDPAAPKGFPQAVPERLNWNGQAKSSESPESFDELAAQLGPAAPVEVRAVTSAKDLLACAKQALRDEARWLVLEAPGDRVSLVAATSRGRVLLYTPGEAPAWAHPEALLRDGPVRSLVVTRPEGAARISDGTTDVPLHLQGQLVYAGTAEGERLLKGATFNSLRTILTHLDSSLNQEDVFSCGKASLRLAAGFLGRALSREEVALAAEQARGSRVDDKGLSLDHVVDAARRLGLNARGFHLDDAGAKTVNELTQRALATLKNPHRVMLITFGRKELGQTGTGHHSVLAGYNPDRNMFLVKDVAGFKTDSFWITPEALCRAMATEDPDWGVQRGYAIVSDQALPRG